MTNERFECELRYQVMLYFASILRDTGIVDNDSLSTIEALMKDKYHPIFEKSRLASTQDKD